MIHSLKRLEKKMRKFFILIILLLGLCCPRSLNAEESKPKKRIALVGDSLCQGIARPLQSLTRKNNFSLSINCLHGTRIDYWSPRIDSIMNTTRPNVIVVSLGTNDSGLRDPEVQRRHIKKIVLTAKKYGAVILWLVPPRLPESFKGQAGIRKLIGEELSASEIFISDNLNLEMIKDKIHMSQKGYADWTASFWKLDIFR